MDITLREKQHATDETSTGYRLRRLRQSQNLSAEQLSKMCGVSKSQILKAERSEFHLKKRDLEKICYTLDIETAYALDLEYQLLYESKYGQVVKILQNKYGTKTLCELLIVNRRIVRFWSEGKEIPSFKHRLEIIGLFTYKNENFDLR